MKIFIWSFLILFFIGFFIFAAYLPEPQQQIFLDVAVAGILISVIGLAAAIGRPKRVGPDGKVYYWRNGYFTYMHPDGKVDFWPGDGKGDGNKKE